MLARLRHAEDIILIEHGPLAARRRLITSVRSGGELIGIIWVAEGGPRRLHRAIEDHLPNGQELTLLA